MSGGKVREALFRDALEYADEMMRHGADRTVAAAVWITGFETGVALATRRPDLVPHVRGDTDAVIEYRLAESIRDLDEASRRSSATVGRSVSGTDVVADAGDEHRERTWTCKVTGPNGALPLGADLLMRDAVREAYQRTTGEEPTHLWSGWGNFDTSQYRATPEARTGEGDR